LKEERKGQIMVHRIENNGRRRPILTAFSLLASCLSLSPLVCWGAKANPEQAQQTAPVVRAAAETSAGEAKAVAEITKMHGGFAVDDKGPGKPVITVYLASSEVTDSSLAHLKGLTRLEELNLSETRISDTGLEHLKGLSQLQQLNLSGTRITDAGLKHLKGLSQLRELNLDGTMVTGTGLANLKGLIGLRDLELAHSGVTDAGLLHLKGLPQLTTLSLTATKLTDAGFANLNGLTKLVGLDVGRTAMTDTGVAYLKGLIQLKGLDLWVIRINLQHSNGKTNLAPSVDFEPCCLASG
jgi:hypothetical protein